MTETNTALTEAITKCDEIKARLETLREMSEPKPVLRLESITRPGTYRELQSADDLADAAPGTVIVRSDGYRFFRTHNPAKPWITVSSSGISLRPLWDLLTRAANTGVTLKYLAAD